MADHLLDGVARLCFAEALATDRCGELLEHLFEGGGLTIDAATGRMVLIPASTIEQLTHG